MVEATSGTNRPLFGQYDPGYITLIMFEHLLIPLDVNDTM